MGSFSKGGEKEENEAKRRKEEKKKKRYDREKDDFAITIFGSFFKSGIGRLSKFMEQYTPL